MKQVLLIAYHFPPFAGSSGVQRALRFAKHLPDFGWKPLVLTAHERAYEYRSDDLVAELPQDIQVLRAPAWDAKRHFSIAGRYPGFTGRPDRWRSWWPGAVLAGLGAIRRAKLDVLWSTFPIATAHAIGATLARTTGLPWVADFRDPMAQEGYPADRAQRRKFVRIERMTVATAARSTFTTPGAVRLYGKRYPRFVDRFQLLENGYDEEIFSATESVFSPLNPGRLTLVHSGVVYPSERDPSQLFAALDQLRSRSPEIFSRLVVRFRAPAFDDLLRKLVNRYAIGACVEILPAVAYDAAIQEMRRADGLLILQAENCNDQIPAKLYEYFRSGRPVLAFADPKGDTAAAMRRVGISAVAPLDNTKEMCGLLKRFVRCPTEGTLPERSAVRGMSRYARTRQLAALFDAIVVGSAKE